MELIKFENPELKAIEASKAEKVERESIAQKKAAEDARLLEEEKKQAELTKGDVAKVEDLVRDLAELMNKYSFRSAENKKMYEKVRILISKIIYFIG